MAMGMGMGVSTSTSSGPFKTSSSYLFSSPVTTRRLTRSTMAATTWMSSYSSTRFLARRSHFLQSTNGPTSGTTSCIISNKFHINFVRTYITEEICPKFDRTRHFYRSEEERRRYVAMDYSNHSTSSTQVKTRDPTPKDMKHMWFEETKRIQQVKENCKKIVPDGTENNNSEAVPPMNNGPKSRRFELRTDELRGTEDGSDYPNCSDYPSVSHFRQSQLRSSSSGETSTLKGGVQRGLPHSSIEAYQRSEVNSCVNIIHSPTHELNGSKNKSLLQIEISSKQEFPNETPINGSGVLRTEGNISSNKADTRTQKPKPKLIDQRENLSRIYDEVLVVDNISTAKEIVGLLTTEYRDLVHACDTEVAKIDVKKETAVDHGEIICFSIYSGPEVNFGNGKKCIWVDVLDGSGKDILMEFAPFFEDPFIKKVWHNYSFDSHVIENYGIKLSGFHADTMHMARLWDSSRRTEGGYSLEALTSDSRVMNGAKSSINKDLIGKISMKTIFGKKKLKKDGQEGKIINIAPVEELQREEQKLWICYSALDSMSTLQLFQSLECKLKEMEWFLNGEYKGNMYQFYEEYWRPFGELLVKMETEGMLVDRAYLAEIEKIATQEQQIAANRFRKWAASYCPDAMHMNVGSDAQLRQLFFGNIQNSKDPNVFLPESKIFKVPNVDNVIEEGKRAPRKLRDITLRKIGEAIETELYTASGWPSVCGDALKTLAGKVSSEYDWSDPLISSDVDDSTDEDLDISPYGTAYNAFGGNTKGKEACHAIAALCEVCSIDSLISNFILPLQSDHISGKNKRIHCSLNINTETGRLSARRPNLQNQPALEKDRYKIRQAFVAAPGNSLVVADYGQLELRILAHLAKCQSMKDAFKAGGDFHSRTAMNMYSHIREAVERKEVLLEWHPQPGEDKPPVPLLKDAFASERRKAKMLNFSIAYGKTPVGLARDWKVSVKEAKATVNLWYKGRQEVLKWQKERKEQANRHRCVQTLLGRTRNFPSLSGASNAHRGHIERAAINTPVQGSAADVAMCAMLEISKNVRLKELGWRLLLQVHDEVILEGPTESAEMAKDIVVECMSKPFGGKNILDVDLAVDAKCAQNWYAAK